MDHDPQYQDKKNGPLSKALRDRLSAFRSFSTLADIGKEIGFSGPFVSQILNEKNPARVDSKHISRIARVVEDNEIKYAKELGLTKPPRRSGIEALPAPMTAELKSNYYIQHGRYPDVVEIVHLFDDLVRAVIFDLEATRVHGGKIPVGEHTGWQRLTMARTQLVEGLHAHDEYIIAEARRAKSIDQAA
jgi:hypothetical protein